MYDKSYYNKWYFIDLLDSYHSILHSDIFITTGAMYYIIYERRKLGEARWRMKNEEWRTLQLNFRFRKTHAKDNLFYDIQLNFIRNYSKLKIFINIFLYNYL